MTVALLGATGLVGGLALRRFAADARFARVVTLDRRPIPPASPTHEPHVVDLDRLADHADLLACDTLVCALGTTMKQAGSKDAFRRVDLEIPFAAAQVAHGQGTRQMLLVSALGSSETSLVFYNRVKGEVERRIESVGFESLGVLHPSLLTGERAESRRGEQISEAVLTVLTPVLVGPLRSLRPTAADDVAAALVALAADPTPGRRDLDPEAIRRLAGRT